MKTWIRRGLIIFGVSTLASLAFVPLGDSGWAEGMRAEQVERRAARQRGDAPKRSRGEPPSIVVRVAGSLVKETLLIGVPAGLVILIAFGGRRWSRRRA